MTWAEAGLEGAERREHGPPTKTLEQSNNSIFRITRDFSEVVGIAFLVGGRILGSLELSDSTHVSKRLTDGSTPNYDNICTEKTLPRKPCIVWHMACFSFLKN